MSRHLSALTVMLVATGCMHRAPEIPQTDLEKLRRFAIAERPLNQQVSYLQSANSSGTAVIYVHGTPGSAQAWVNYVEQPVEHSYSVAIDRPGFGQSSPTQAYPSLQMQSAAIEAVLPAKGEPVVLVGHSLGGAVVAQFATQHPDRIKALVLLASSLDPGQEKINPLQYLAKLWPLSRILPTNLSHANEELMGFKEQLMDLEPLLENIKAPVIIVHGTEDDLVPFANVEFMQKHLTHAACVKTVVLEHQNHFLPWNSELTVRQAIAWALEATC